MSGETTHVTADAPQPGDKLIRYGFWVLLGVVAVVEIAAVSFGFWRNYAFRASFIAIVLAAVASLMSLSRTPTQARPQKMRSLAIAWMLGLMVLLFYAATIVRLGGNVFNRAL